MHYSSSSNDTILRVSPAKPSYLEYHIPQNVWSVIVRAQSTDDLCGVMSVQPFKVSFICIHFSVKMQVLYLLSQLVIFKIVVG